MMVFFLRIIQEALQISLQAADFDRHARCICLDNIVIGPRTFADRVCNSTQ